MITEPANGWGELPTPEWAMEPYADLVENSDQALAILLYSPASGELPVVPCGIPQVLEPEYGGMPATLEQALPSLYEKLGPARWVILHSEAYMRHYEPGEVTRDTLPERGDMQRDREAGDFRVMETVLLVGCDASGSWTYTKPFERVGGVVIWGEAQRVHTADDGLELDSPLINVLAKACQ